jgi:hypothetical protein
MDTENDKYRYQGSELQFIGVDELPQLTESRIPTFSPGYGDCKGAMSRSG